MTHWLCSWIVRGALMLGAAASVGSVAAGQEVLSLPFGRSPAALSPGGGFASGPGSGGGAAVWAPGSGWEDIGGPGGPGIAVSDDGNVVLAGGAGAGEVWVRGAGWFSLGLAGVQRAMALSSDGRYVAALAGPSLDVPYLWDRSSGALTRLEVPVGATGVTVSGLSLGAVLSVGVAESLGGTTQAVVWDATGAITQVAPMGSRCFAVSDNGEWATGSIDGATGALAFRWNRSVGRVGLPALMPGPGAPAFHRPLKVSDDGALIIGNRDVVGTIPQGFAWTPTFGTRSLQDHLQFEGLGSVGAFTNVLASAGDGRRFLLSDGLPAVSTQYVNVDAQVSLSYCGPGVPNSTGAAAMSVLLGATGPDVNALFLRASGLPVGATVVPLLGRDPASIPLAGGSAGTLCLGGGIGRFRAGVADASGQFQVRVDLAALPTPQGPVAGSLGETWRFQCWYRDAAVGGSNFTDGGAVLLD